MRFLLGRIKAPGCLRGGALMAEGLLQPGVTAEATTARRREPKGD